MDSKLVELLKRIKIPRYYGNMSSLDGIVVEGYFRKCINKKIIPSIIPPEIVLIIFDFFNTSTVLYKPQINDEEQKYESHDRNFQYQKKILLLGTPFTGKSTVLKSLKFAQNDIKVDTKYTGHDIDIHCTIIRQNCVVGILTLLQKSKLNHIEHQYQLNAIAMVIKYGCNQHHATYNFTDNDSKYNHSELGKAINILWNIPTIHSVYIKRFEYKYLFPDNMEYFFDKIDEIMQINYEPSSEDILKYKTVKYSVTDASFYFSSHSGFNFIDLGDYECKSQIYSDVIQKGHFDDRIVIFTAALSDYCIYDSEAKKMKMQVSIDYLKEIMSSSYFRKNYIILIFTKLDIFYDCIRCGISLSNCFSDWNGVDYVNPKIKLVVTYIIRNEFIYVTDYIIQLIQNYIVMENDRRKSSASCAAEATQFIAEKYDEVNENRRERQLYIHKANCMDTTNVEKVFADVRHIVINSNLARGPI
eukprot:257757_1